MNHQESQKQIIMKKFSNIHDVTHPLITTTEFKQKYGNGFKVFTREGVKQAINDLGDVLQKGLGDNDMIKSLTNEINSCEKVFVTNGRMTDVFLVKPYTVEEIEKAQKADLEKGEEDDIEKEEEKKEKVPGKKKLEKSEDIEQEDEDDDDDSDDVKKSKKKSMKKSEDDDSNDE